MINKLLVGVKNKVGRQDMRRPVTLVILRKLVQYIELLWGFSYGALMLTAILALMFTLGLRVGEVAWSGTDGHSLWLQDITWIKKAGRLKLNCLPTNSHKGKARLSRYMHKKGCLLALSIHCCNIWRYGVEGLVICF